MYMGVFRHKVEFTARCAEGYSRGVSTQGGRPRLDELHIESIIYQWLSLKLMTFTQTAPDNEKQVYSEFAEKTKRHIMPFLLIGAVRANESGSKGPVRSSAVDGHLMAEIGVEWHTLNYLSKVAERLINLLHRYQPKLYAGGVDRCEISSTKMSVASRSIFTRRLRPR